MAWQTRFVPGYAPDGAPLLSVLAKQTYRFAPDALAEADEENPLPFVEADEYWGGGNPAADPMKLESELVPYKPLTDIVLLGNAHAPRGKKAYHLDMGIQVGGYRKTLRVIGNRKVFVTGSGIGFTDPEPFESLPLHYGLAYGGADGKSEKGRTFIYPKNPVGRGFVVRNHPEALQDLLLPNLEDPQRLLTPGNLVLGSFDKWPEAPEPQSLGYTGRNFHPRITWAGLPPDEAESAEIGRLQDQAKGPSPASSAPSSAAGPKPDAPPAAGGVPAPSPLVNPLFFNGASSGLMTPYLTGAETVLLAYLDPDHPQFRFTLPGEKPRAFLDIGEGPATLDMVLQSLVIYKGSNQAALIWRGSVYYEGPESMRQWAKLEFGVEG